MPGLDPQKRKTELGQYPAIFTPHLVNNAHIQTRPQGAFLLFLVLSTN